jgi:hypothetical protein
VDLFDPSSGSQVHDFNPGVRPSGLFWIAQVPESALITDGRIATLHIENVPVTDNLFFLGPGQIPATVSATVTWSTFGDVQHFRPTSSDPTAPSAFAGQFRFTNAIASFSVSEPGFSAQSMDASSTGLFGEMGTERNGFFLQLP